MPCCSYARKFFFALTAVGALGFFAFQAGANPVTKDDAAAAVSAWLKYPGHGLTAPLGNAVMKTQTFAGAGGAPAYHVVYLKPSGFVIVAADDLLEPIICFCPAGHFDPSLTNPLGALVTRDVPNRVAAARAMPMAAMLSPEGINAQVKWARLRAVAAGTLPPPTEKASISDVRVAPLTQTTWSQDVAGDDTNIACYNYYTPSASATSADNAYATPGDDTNDVCGCVATAMAQLMRFWQYPTTGVGTGTYQVEVADETDGIWLSVTASLRGGDGSGGVYKWSSMILSPGSSITSTQCQAIGALCADAGTAVNMEYSPGASGAYIHDCAAALYNTFKFNNAVMGGDESDNVGAGLVAMLNPNLDAGFPCLLGINNSTEGHAIVADGYGYDSGTLYHHLNMGWSGSDNAWYNLPLINTSWITFNVVDSCIYNIYESGSGEILSGRVVNLSGNPISGVTMTATGTGGSSYSGTTTTNAKGIYAFAKIPSASSVSVAASHAGYWFNTPQAKTTGTSTEYSSVSGNVWSVNFADQGQPLNLTMAANPTAGGSTYPTQGQVAQVGKNVATAITAYPASHYVLDHWGCTTGAVVADPYAMSTTATLTANATVTAYFVQPPPGAIWGWGLDSNGQLGNNSTTQRLHPTQTAASLLTNPSQIVGGLYHTLALAGDGSVWAWGCNSSGQLGIGTLADSHVPVRVSSLSGILWIEAGTHQSFAVDASGAVWAWGCNSAGQLGDGTKTNRKSPVKVVFPAGVSIVQVAAGDCHTLALDSNGNVWAWGTNNRGQLGKNAHVLYSLLPMKVTGLPGISFIAAGSSFSLALAEATPSIWDWGANESGQLGLGTHSDIYTPTVVSGISSVIYIGAGANHSLAITNDGSVWAWGANNYGQIGIGSSVTTCATPMHIVKSAGGTLGNGVQVAGGSCHSVVLDSSGNVWTVGSSAQGQIGDGTTTTHRTAADIAGLLPASQIGAGGWSSYCIEANSSSTPFTAPGLLTSARNAEPQPAAPSTQDDSTAGASSAVAAAQSAPAAAAPDQSGQGAAASAAASSQAAAPDVGSGASVGTGAAGLATVAAIVDNLDQSATKRFQPLSGAWVTQALAGVANGAYAGGFAAAASSSGAETARARFSCSSLTAGQYDVYAWWPAMADNATHVAYDIHHAAGVTTVRVNQTERGGQWNLLGTFTFVGGSHVVDVQNSSSQPGASVCADAVKFVPAGK